MAPMLNILSTHPFQSKHLLGLFSSNNTTMGSVGIITTTTTSWLYENYGDILILIDFLPQKHIILVKIWFCSDHNKKIKMHVMRQLSHCKIPQLWKTIFLGLPNIPLAA